MPTRLRSRSVKYGLRFERKKLSESSAPWKKL
jgi:hypothetical protein